MSTSIYQPDFDPNALRRLEQALPHDHFIAFVEDYLASGAERLTRAETVCAGGDLAELGAEAHQMVMATGSFGLRRASALARQLAEACHAGQADDAQTLCVQLAASTRRVWSELREWFLGPSN